MNSDYSKIFPDHFFNEEKEKTKFNWFAFELACEIEHATPYDLKKYLSKKGYTKESFNKACIKLAKALQPTVIKTLNNEIKQMQFNHTDVEKAFPGVNNKTVNSLLNATAAGWDNLLQTCGSCPSACITNKDNYCPMFDDKHYYR